LADSAVKSTGGVESAGSSSHNISKVFAMARIVWVNVWTRSRSWSGFIVYLSSLTFCGVSGFLSEKLKESAFKIWSVRAPTAPTSLRRCVNIGEARIGSMSICEVCLMAIVVRVGAG